MNKEQLKEKLRDVVPVVKKGQVTLWRDFETDDEKDVGKELGLTSAYVDAHPEGSDRGGYVPYAEFDVEGETVIAFYMELDGEWSVD